MVLQKKKIKIKSKHVGQYFEDFSISRMNSGSTRLRVKHTLLKQCFPAARMI